MRRLNVCNFPAYLERPERFRYSLASCLSEPSVQTGQQPPFPPSARPQGNQVAVSALLWPVIGCWRRRDGLVPRADATDDNPPSGYTAHLDSLNEDLCASKKRPTWWRVVRVSANRSASASIDRSTSRPLACLRGALNYVVPPAYM